MKIELNKQLDKEVYLSFHKATVGGVDFGKKILDMYFAITEDNYNEYIDAYYSTEEKVMINVLNEMTKCFEKVEGATCYLSIFDFGPRYVKKSFQAYYKLPIDQLKEAIEKGLEHFT